MQMWTMVFRGRRYGPYPWWVMRWIFYTMKEAQEGDSATAKLLLSILISSAMKDDLVGINNVCVLR